MPKFYYPYIIGALVIIAIFIINKKCFNFFKGIPFGSRQPFFYYIRRNMCAGFAGGLVLNPWILYLKQALNGSAFQISAFLSLRQLGFVASLIVPSLLQVKKKRSLVYIGFIPTYIMFLILLFTTNNWVWVVVAGLALSLPSIGANTASAILKTNYPSSIRGHVFSRNQVWGTGSMLVATYAIGDFLKKDPKFFKPSLLIYLVLVSISIYLFTKMKIRDERLPSQLKRLQEKQVKSAQKKSFTPDQIRWFLFLLVSIAISSSLIYKFANKTASLLFLAGTLILFAVYMVEKVRELSYEGPDTTMITISKVAGLLTDFRFLFYQFLIYIGLTGTIIGARVYVDIFDGLGGDQKLWAFVGGYGIVVRGIMVLSGRSFWGRHIDKHPIPMYGRMWIYILWGCTAFVYAIAPKAELLLIASALSGLGMGVANINTTLMLVYFGKKPEDVALYATLNRMIGMVIGIISPFIPNLLMRPEIGLSIRQVALVASGLQFTAALFFGLYFLYEKIRHPNVTGDGIKL